MISVEAGQQIFNSLHIFLLWDLCSSFSLYFHSNFKPHSNLTFAQSYYDHFSRVVTSANQSDLIKEQMEHRIK